MSQKRKPLFVERMQKETICGYTVRIWISIKNIDDPYEFNSPVSKVVSDMQVEHSSSYNPIFPEEIVERLGELECIAAVEVTNDGGDGVVAYFEWP